LLLLLLFFFAVPRAQCILGTLPLSYAFSPRASILKTRVSKKKIKRKKENKKFLSWKKTRETFIIEKVMHRPCPAEAITEIRTQKLAIVY
jgi:hypothetical protein